MVWEKTQKEDAWASQILTSYFADQDMRTRKEIPPNNTKPSKAWGTLPIIFRSLGFLGALFICDLCAHDVDLDWVQILLLGLWEDLWHPLGEKNKTVICSQKSCQESPWLEGSETHKTDKKIGYHKTVHFSSKTDNFFPPHQSKKESKLIGHLEAQKESLPLLWICKYESLPYITMNNTSISSP